MTNSPRDKGYREKRTKFQWMPILEDWVERRDRASQDWQENQVSIIKCYIKWKWHVSRRLVWWVVLNAAARLNMMRKIPLDLAN